MIPLPPPPPPPPVPPFFDDDDELLRRDERLPHWSEQETRDLIETRAQVEWGLAAPAAKRAKNLWEVVAERMREKGYWRSGDQCKWKWKYLVSRYKVYPFLFLFYFFQIKFIKIYIYNVHISMHYLFVMVP